MLTLPTMQLAQFMSQGEIPHVAQPSHEVLMTAMNQCSMGVLLIDPTGMLVHANHAGNQLLERDDGIRLRTDKQLDATPINPVQTRLNIWLQHQCAPTHTEVVRFVHVYLARRANSLGHYSVQCTPIRWPICWHVQGQPIGAIVCVSAPEKFTLPDASRLASLYGFTKGQALVAYELSLGKNRKEIARSLDITPDTVRSQAQKVFRTMGVKSQANMMRTILTLGHPSI